MYKRQIYTGAKFTRLYFKDCYIDGTTDFIFGPSTALFEDVYKRQVHDEGLREAGLFNLKGSLFERLYRFHLKEESPKAIDMLCRQGRMHPVSYTHLDVYKRQTV